MIKTEIEFQSKLLGKRFAALEKAWASCERCPFAEFACQKVHGRGLLNCEYLLVGEAPGKAEDALGAPFVGRAGKLLSLCLPKSSSFFICNALACRPTAKRGGPNESPLPKEIENCWPRFFELAKLANPSRGIVLLGQSARVHEFRLRPWFPDAQIRTFWHPAYVLRQGGTNSSVWPEYLKSFRDFYKKTGGK